MTEHMEIERTAQHESVELSDDDLAQVAGGESLSLNY